MPEASRNCHQNNLNRLLRPRHIAYIGGSHVTGPLATSLNRRDLPVSYGLLIQFVTRLVT